MAEKKAVLMRLDITMRTDRDPFEMADALAAFVQSSLEDENPDQIGTIDVGVQNAEVLR